MYITFKYNSNRQISFTELFNNFDDLNLPTPIQKTYTVQLLGDKLDQFKTKYDLDQMQRQLNIINENIITSEFRLDDMQQYYNTFFIPKRNGGVRRIDAPKDNLMTLQRTIKENFEYQFYTLAHNNAYAYVKGRSTKDALTVHQQNQSKWFLKVDIKDFFPSCNLALLQRQFRKIFPFGCLDQQLLINIFKLCLINDKMPQGTPMSPLLTNLLMIPYDYAIHNTFNNFNRSRYVYTRYADDILISSKYKFDHTVIVSELKTILQPFIIADNKTRFGSAHGANWNLGLMLNKDNNITIGWKRRERLRASINNFLSTFSTNRWNKNDTEALSGLISYYHQVQPEMVQDMITKYEIKYELNLQQCIQQIIS